MNPEDYTFDIRKTKRPIDHIVVVYNGSKIMPHEYDQSRWEFMLNHVANHPNYYRVVFKDETATMTGEDRDVEQAHRVTVFIERELKAKNLKQLGEIATAKGVTIADDDEKKDIIAKILQSQLE